MNKTYSVMRAMAAMLGCTPALLPLLAHATSPSSDEDLFLAPLPLVLTASRLSQVPADVPAPMTIIDRAMITASGFTEIQDLLRLVPGFLVSDWPGGSPTVVNHGMGDAYGRRLLVLIDGRSVVNPFMGNVDWQDLPIRVEDIERIEVVRGPNAASYGANAVQGVVNIITRSPRTEAGNTALARAGNKDLFETAVRLNGDNDTFDWRVTASRRRAVNFENKYVKHFQDAETIYRDVFNLQTSWQLSNVDEMRMQIGYSAGNNLIGTGSSTDPVHHTENHNEYAHLNWRHSYAPDKEFSLQFYHFGRSERDDYDAATSGLEIPVSADIDIVRDDLEAQYTGRLSDSLQATLGGGVRQDQIRSDYYFANEGNVGGTQWQLYGNLAWRALPDWLINAGGMLEKHYNTDTLFSPRLALNYTLAPDHVLRASAGYGYRAPTATEASSNEQTWYNGEIVRLGRWSVYDVEPEHVRFHEIGYLGKLRALHLDIDARLFWEHHSGYLDDQTCRYKANVSNACPFAAPDNYSPVLGSYAYYYINSGQIYLRGADLSLDWNDPEIGRIVFSQSVANAHADSRVTDPDIEKSVPAYSASLLMMHTFPYAITASIGLYHVAEMYWLNDGDVVPRQTRTDLRVAKAFGTGNVNEFAVTVQALEGAYPEFHEGRYTAERRVFATLKLGF